VGISLSNATLITIYGGSGFLGRHIVRALAKTGARMRIAVRRPDLAGHLQPLGGVGQIMPVQANVRVPESLAGPAEGADAVINLVGILFQSGKQTFKSVQDEGAGHVARAAKAAGARAMVHVSAIGSNPDSSSLYARSKAAGEKAVRDAFPDATILRPSVVFGPEDQFFNRFAAMARLSPVLPLIGGGGMRLQPVFAGDVAKAVLASLTGEGKPASVYELGGPEVMTLREVMERVLAYSMRRRALINLPFPLAKLQGALLQVLPNPPLTLDQVRLLETDNVVSDAAMKDGRTLSGLGIDPLAVEAVVPDYLEQYRPKGQFSDYRP
jgi:NADH dehydrogenase